MDGKNIVIMQGFKEYFGLGFFQGALLTDPKKVLVQLGELSARTFLHFPARVLVIEAARAATGERR